MDELQHPVSHCQKRLGLPMSGDSTPLFSRLALEVIALLCYRNGLVTVLADSTGLHGLTRGHWPLRFIALPLLLGFYAFRKIFRRNLLPLHE